MKKLQDKFPIIIFALISVIIILPIISPGYILTMDSPFTPRLPWSSWTSPNLFGNLLAVLSQFIPSYILQKILLFIIFFLSGWGMFRIVQGKLGFAGYFAGIFYMINPFVYERVMAGHWQLLLAYGLFPFFVRETFNFLEKNNSSETIKLCIMITFLINLSLHYALIYLVYFVISIITYIFLDYDAIKSLGKNILKLVAICLLLNLNWIVPLLLGKSELVANIGMFSIEDVLSFQSVSDSTFGLIFNLLSGYGFWPEVYNYFILAKNIIIIWPLLSVIFLLFSVYGLIKIIFKKDKSLLISTIPVVILLFLSLDFAGGVALKSFSQTALLLYEKFPILRGFREPQKLVGIIMFSIAFFGSYGFYYLSEKLSGKIKYTIISIVIILPLLYTPTVFAGFWGQLKPVSYPASWNKINEIITYDKDNYIMVFFPWQQYMRFNFSNNLVISNPAKFFFSKPVVSSSNYETDFLYSHETRSEVLHVDGLLRIEREKLNLLGDTVDGKISWGESLQPINVKYIILAKEDDWVNYSFLDNQIDLKKVYDSSDIALYQNLKWGMVEEELDVVSEIEQ